VSLPIVAVSSIPLTLELLVILNLVVTLSACPFMPFPVIIHSHEEWLENDTALVLKGVVNFIMMIDCALKRQLQYQFATKGFNFSPCYKMASCAGTLTIVPKNSHRWSALAKSLYFQICIQSLLKAQLLPGGLCDRALCIESVRISSSHIKCSRKAGF
jgi:hypothetical protein